MNDLQLNRRQALTSNLREETFGALTRSEGRQAFDLSREPAAVRERYGMHRLGQNLLLARRNSGVLFVTVNGWTGQTDHDKPGNPTSTPSIPRGNPIRPEQLAGMVDHALHIHIPINSSHDATSSSRSPTTGMPTMELPG